MRKLIQYTSALLCFFGSCVSMHAAEISIQEETVRDDLKILFNTMFQNEHMEFVTTMFAQQAIDQSGKEMDAASLVAKFKEFLNGDGCMEELGSPYLTYFSCEEIHQLRCMYELPIFKKQMQYSREIAEQNVTVIQTVLRDLAIKLGREGKLENASHPIIELNEDNFHAVVENSQKPVIIDIYSTTCPPCKKMEPILEELNAAYGEAIQFAKIDCRDQAKLAERYKVTRVPTFLFLKPGQASESLRLTGFTAKEDLKEKIDSFLKS